MYKNSPSLILFLILFKSDGSLMFGQPATSCFLLYFRKVEMISLINPKEKVF